MRESFFLLCMTLWAGWYSLLAHHHDATIMRSIPLVECVDNNFDIEVKYFLSNNLPANDGICFWNMYCKGDRNTGYSCILYKDVGKNPNRGWAYMQYGKNIIILQGKTDKALFRRIAGIRRTILMLKKEAPQTITVPYLSVQIDHDHHLRELSSNFELSEHVDSLSLQIENSDPFAWVDRGEKGDICLEQSLPQVKIVINILDSIIVHYLGHLPCNDNYRFWNLSVNRQPYTYRDSIVNRCTIVYEPFRPDIGTAYLKYGNDILVITSELDNSLFLVVPGKEMIIPVIKNRIPLMNDYSFMDVSFTKGVLLKEKRHMTMLQ